MLEALPDQRCRDSGVVAESQCLYADSLVLRQRLIDLMVVNKSGRLYDSGLTVMLHSFHVIL